MENKKEKKLSEEEVRTLFNKLKALETEFNERENNIKNEEERIKREKASLEKTRGELQSKALSLSNEAIKRNEEYTKEIDKLKEDYEKKGIEYSQKANKDANEIKANAIEEAKKLQKEIEDLKKSLSEELQRLSNEAIKQDRDYTLRLNKKEDEANKVSQKILKEASDKANQIREDAQKDFLIKNDEMQKALSDAKLSLSSTLSELNSVKGVLDKSENEKNSLQTSLLELQTKLTNLLPFEEKYKDIEKEYKKVIEENTLYSELKTILGEDNNLSNVLQEIKELKEKKEELNNNVEEYNKNKRSLEFKEKILDNKERNQDSLIEEEANKKRNDEISLLNEELMRKNERIKALEEERRASEDLENVIKDFSDRYKNLDPLDVNRQYEKLNEKLISSLEGIRKINETGNREYLTKIEELENSITQKNDENLQHYKRLISLEEDYHQKDAELLRLSNEKNALETKNNFLNEQLKIYSEAYKNGEEEEKRKEEINRPLFTKTLPPRNKDAKEKDVLQEVRDKIRGQGIIIPDRLLLAFHTALKSQDYSLITVLAGMSGTGKSQLPQLYSHFIGMNHLLVTVLPNWDSPEDMLGYYNPMENKFDAEDVLRFLAQAQRGSENQNGLGSFMNLILLDEMNLSYVERYFAPFLDLLEARRNYSQDNVPQYNIKLGTNMKYPIKLTDNVLWTGTMNQDETTKSLSDKVIDRGIVLNFPSPQKLVGISQDVKKLDKQEGEEPHLLLKETWENWKRPNEEIKNLDLSLYSETIDKINKALERTGKGIGYRSWDSIECYIKNHPEVRENPKDTDAINRAFEDQLVQKVMPKLRGLATKGEQGKALEKIRSILEVYPIVTEGDFQNAMDMGYGQFMWTTANYLSNSHCNYFKKESVKDNKGETNNNQIANKKQNKQKNK